MKPLKIGIVLDSSLDLEDGVQQYVMTIGEWLRRSGHDVHYLVGETKERQLPNIHSLSRNIVVKFNGNHINLPLWGNKKKIRQVLRVHTFDILYVQTPFHPLMAQQIILAAPKSTAVIGSYNILPHSKFVAYANWALRLLLLPSLKRFYQMLAVSAAAARYEEWTFGLPATVSPNVFDYSLFHLAEPFERYTDDTYTILFFGRLVERKGCMRLLEAAKLLKQMSDIPKFRVVVCGKGPLETELKKYVADNGLFDQVEFTGFVSDEDKPRYYASADISVFPSSGGESFGIVLLEAMASGRAAVLAGNNPGYASVMEAQPALLFAPHDVSELASKLKTLLLDHDLRLKMADWGEAETVRYDVEVVGKQLINIYTQALQARR